MANVTKKLIFRGIIIILALMLLFPAFAVQAADNLRAAKITDFGGAVMVRKAGGEKDFAAFKGMGLAEGDAIITGKGAWASVAIDDDKEVRVGENTRINISELKGSADEAQTGINLLVGKLWAGVKKALNVRSKFEIKTSTTVAGVRGTNFFVGSDRDGTVIGVIEGRVYAITAVGEQGGGQQGGGAELQNQLETIVEPGQQITINQLVQALPDIKVAPVDFTKLDTAILQGIKESGQVTDTDLLKKIDDQITTNIKNQEQNQSQDQNQDNNTNQNQQNSGQSGSNNPTVVYEDDGSSKQPTTTGGHENNNTNLPITGSNIKSITANFDSRNLTLTFYGTVVSGSRVKILAEDKYHTNFFPNDDLDSDTGWAPITDGKFTYVCNLSDTSFLPSGTSDVVAYFDDNEGNTGDEKAYIGVVIGYFAPTNGSIYAPAVDFTLTFEEEEEGVTK